MRHRKAGLKLGRTSEHRKAMLRNMVTSLFKHDRIRTTDAKAKALRTWADHMVTLAKRGDLHARRQALAVIREKDVVHKLFEQARERFGAAPGGYTRIVKLGRRPGDAAPLSLVELVEAASGPAGKKKTRPDKAKQPAREAEKKADEAPAADDATKESETAEVAPATTPPEEEK